MSSKRSEVLDKAKKLKALADRGVGGEMANAKVMFDKYKQKHSITEDELNEYKESSHYANMSDEAFLREMTKEAIPLAIAHLMLRFIDDDEPQKQGLREQISIAGNILLSAIEERTKRKRR